MKRAWIAAGLYLSIAAAGCGGGGTAEVREDRLTVGKVQGEIKVGLVAAQVAELLGSPNIVTTDEKRREVWIYDKVSTDRVDMAHSSFAGIILVMGGTSSESSCATRQRTLTIIIKYDEEKKVRDFAYNYTQFYPELRSRAVAMAHRDNLPPPFEPTRRVCDAEPAGGTLPTVSGESEASRHADAHVRNIGREGATLGLGRDAAGPGV